LLTDSAATVFTSSGDSLVEMIHLYNQHSSAVTFTLSVGTDAAGTRLWDSYPIPADKDVKLRLYLALADGEVLQAYSGTDAVLNISVDGRTL
jgi:hypothetical protein